MKKLVSLFAMVVILLTFSIATSGCGGNRNQYFVDSDEIVEVENNAKIEIKEMFVEKEPEFYNPDIYMDKKELFISGSVEYNSSIFVKTEITPYGLMFSGANQDKKKYDRHNIVVDKSKNVSGFEETRIFDKNNSLSYVSNKFDNVFRLDGILRCNKLTKNNIVESWNVKLPFADNRNYICQRTLKNNLVVYGPKNISLIDTKNIKILKTYELKNDKMKILHVIPQNELLWVFCVNSKLGELPIYTFDTGFLDNYNSFHTYFGDDILTKAFVIDTSKNLNNTFLLKKLVKQVKCMENIISLNSNDELFVIDNNLNTQHCILSELHKGALFTDLFLVSRHLNIETDCIGVHLNNKKYVLNIENPSELFEIPEGLMNINYNYRGYDWDYCYKKDGYYYGYNIYTKERTWKFKTESGYDTPLYSTDNGIFLFNWYMDKQKFIVTAYGEKK